MKIDCIIKSGGIAPTDFSGMFARIGAIIDVMSMAEPLLARPNWRMKGYTLEEAQARAVYALDSGVNRTRLAELEDEYRGKDVSSIGIWLDGRREGLGASIEIMACGGTFPDTVSVDARGAFLDRKNIVASIVARSAQEFAPVAITAAPDDYEAQQAFDDRPGVGWMLYLPVELTAQQIPEAQELIPVVSADGGRRLGTIIVSIKDEPFSIDNEAHLVAAHDIEVRLISMDLLPRFIDI